VFDFTELINALCEKLEKNEDKKQHNFLYKCINLDAPFISFQSQSAGLKKMDLVSPDHPMHLKN
jgi:DNA-directed RNA polymerase delta subunit